jgi:thioredoxin 1
MAVIVPFPGTGGANGVQSDSSVGPQPVHLTDQTFDVEVSKGITFVDFWAVWCTPCKMVAPIVEKLAVEWNGKIKIAKLDTDENPLTSGKLGIMSIPTFMVYANGKPVAQFSGAMPKEYFDKTLNQIYAEYGPKQEALPQAA